MAVTRKKSPLAGQRERARVVGATGAHSAYTYKYTESVNLFGGCVGLPLPPYLLRQMDRRLAVIGIAVAWKVRS